MSNQPIINNKSVVHGIELRADTAIQGLQTAVPASVTQVPLGGVIYSVADAIKLLQGAVEPWKDARAAHATIRQIMLGRPQAEAQLNGLLVDLRNWARTFLGNQSEVLTQFGFKPQKPAKQLTPEQKTLKAAKAKLTRQKRGTLGSKQKAALGTTGTPSVAISPSGGVTITPAAAPASTNPPASAVAKPTP